MPAPRGVRGNSENFDGQTAKIQTARFGEGGVNFYWLPVAMPDKYQNFERLKAGEVKGLDYDIRVIKRDRPVAIITPHGGEIEPYTTLIAEKIAGDRYNFYSFIGLNKKRPHGDLHITSSKFDEPDCLKLVSACDVVVAVHGRKDGTDRNTVWLGGRDIGLRDAVNLNLKASGFLATLAPDCKLRGETQNNICNRGRRKAGVQLELPRTLREILSSDELCLNKFASAISEAIESH